MRSKMVDVTLSQSGERFFGPRCHVFRKRRRLVAVMHSHCFVAQMTEFSRTENRGVARQNLLHQGSSGTRHTHDKDGDLRKIADTGFLLQEILRKHTGDPVEQRERRPLVISNELPLDPASFHQMPKSNIVLPQIFSRFGKSVVQFDSFVL